MISGRRQDRPLLGLKYNKRDGDKPLTAVENPELICDATNEEKYEGKYEGLIFGYTEVVKLVRFDITMLGLDDFPKLGEQIGFTWIKG